MKNSPKKVLKTTDEKIDYIVSIIDNLATKTELAEGLDNLAIMTANSFAHQDKELAAIKEDVRESKERVAMVEEVVKNTRQDILTIGDKFVSRPEFEKHVVNFGNLERKVNQITN